MIRLKKQYLLSLTLVSFIFWNSAFAAYDEFIWYADKLAWEWVVNMQWSSAWYRVLDNLSRWEAAAMIVRHTDWEDLTSLWNVFSDMDKNNTFTKYVEKLATDGKISKSRANFYPNANITRAEFLKIAINGLYWTDWSVNTSTTVFKDVTDSEQIKYINKALDEWLISSNNYFRPNDSITRWEAFKIISKSIDAIAATNDLWDIFNTDTWSTSNTGSNTSTWTTTVTPTWSLSDLNVALATDNPAWIAVPASAQWVVLWKFTLTSTKDTTVDRLKFVKMWLSSNQALAGVTIYVNWTRITSVRTLNNDNTIDFNLYPTIVVKSGTPIDVSLVGNINTVANSSSAEISFTLNEIGQWTNTKTVSLTTNKFNVVWIEAGSITISNNGTLAPVKVGETAKDLYKFKIYNPSSTESVVLKSVMFKQIGSIQTETELENIWLYTDAWVLVSKVAKANSDYIKFDFWTGMTLSTLKTLRFSIKWDITGWAGRTIQFELNNIMDLYAVNQNMWYGVKTSATVIWDSLTVWVGAVVLGSVDTGNSYITKNKKDVALAKFKLTANSWKNLQIDRFYIYAENTWTGVPMTTFLENVRLFDETSGYGYDLDYQSGGTASGYYLSNSVDYLIPNKTSHTFLIKANVKNLTGTDLTNFTKSVFYFKINTSGTNAMRISSYDDNSVVTDITPSVLTFNTLNGSATAVSLYTLPLSSSKNAVIGSKDVDALEFEIKNSDVNDIRLNSLEISWTPGSGWLNGSLISEVKLYKDSVSDSNLLVSVSWNQATNNKLSFDGLWISVLKNSTQKFIITTTIVDDISNVGKQVRIGLTAADITDSEWDDSFIEGTTSALTIATYTSDRTLVLTNGWAINTIVNNSYVDTNKDKTFLANTTSPYVATYEVISQWERMKLKDIDIVATEDVAGDFKKSISAVILYNKDKTEIARQSVTNNTVSFTNINYIVAEGSENIYVKLISRKIWKDEAGAKTWNMRIAFAVKKVEWADSFKQLTAPAQSLASNSFTVYPVRLSNVELVNSYNGYSINSKLLNGDNNAAIIKLTGENWNNTNTSNWATLKLLLSQIKMKMSKYTGTTVNSVTIEKINGSDTPITWSVAGWYITFNTSTFTSDQKIETNSMSYYLVKVNVTKDNVQTTDDYVRFDFDWFNTWEVSYKSDEVGDTDITKLGLDIVKLDWTQINE